MAFGGFQHDGTQPLMSEINTTPLVDVMLVLLVIFMITAPLFSSAIRVELPRVAATPLADEPRAIRLALDAEGALYWDDSRVGDDEFAARLAQAAQRQPQPEVHLRADRGTRYERLARIMAAAQNAGITRLGFVTEPDGNPRR